MLRKRLFTALAAIANTSTSWWVLAGAIVLTAISIALLPHLTIITSREGMVDKNLPVQKRYIETNKEFGAQNQLIIVVEGKPKASKEAAKEIADALLINPKWVKNIFYRIDLAPFKKSGLFYLTFSELTRLSDSITENENTLATLFANGNWNDVLKELEKSFSEISTDDLKDEEALDQAFGLLDRFFTQWQDFLEDPSKSSISFSDAALGEEAEKRGMAQIDSEGFISGNNGHMRVLFVQQAHESDDIEFTLPFMKYCRETVASVLKKHPGVSAGFTGWPVSGEEEIKQVEVDLGKITLISGVIILAIFLIAFRSIHRMVLVFIPLTFGILWNLGLTVFTVGHLNYITSVFGGILFGLGIDYGVVFVRRFDEERAKGNDASTAVANTLLAVGPSILTGAGTTIAAFFAVGMTDQPAFSELGIVAGCGVSCVLISTFLILPVLLRIFPPKAKSLESLKARSESKTIEKLSTWTLKFPVTLFIIGLIAFLALLSFVPKVGFDLDVINMLPKNSETILTAQRLEESTSYQMQYISVVSDTLEQARTLKPLVEKCPTVSKVESISSLIPANQKQKQEMMNKLVPVVSKIKIGHPEASPDLDALKATLSSLTEKVETGQEDAFSDGRTLLVKHLDMVLDHLENIRSVLNKPNASKRQEEFEKALFTSLETSKQTFLDMLTAPRITLNSVDPQLLDRFQSSTSGRFITMVFPKEKIWDVKFLDQFIDQVESASKEVHDRNGDKRLSGFAVVFQVTSRQIQEGFVKSSWIAAFVVFFMLLLDFRRPFHVLLAMMPLAAGVVATIGGLGLIGHNLNLASQISFPILLGIGVDYGVLLTRRWLEKDGDDLPKVAKTIGSAITVAAFTTMVGFGTLMLSSHRGLIAFGELLTLAVFICLMTAIFALPIVIKIFRIKR